MSDLPEGWTEVPLGDLGEWYGGGTPSKSNPDYWTSGSIPWLSPKDMGDDVIHETKDRITEKAIAESSVRLVPEGSVAIVVRSGILERTLPVGLVPFATTLNQDMKAVHPSPDVLPEWVAWGIRAGGADLLNVLRKSGTTVASIETSRLMTTCIPIPPLDEQRRIVAILEAHLSRLDAATWGLRAADARSDALQRRAIVELLSVGGAESELQDVLEVSIGGLWGEPPGGSELDVMVLRVTELGMWGALDPRTSAVRSITHKQYESRSLQLGDLLLEKSGGGPATPVGRVGLVTGLEGPAICSNFMQLMRPDRSRILPRWLHLYLNACHLAGRTNKMQKASTNIRNIKASEYLQMVISVPTLDEQESVVAACEGWLLRGSRLKATVGDIRGRAVDLRLALLQSAFSGELTRESISV